jgi:AraC-like DNA-binding protein
MSRMNGQARQHRRRPLATLRLTLMELSPPPLEDALGQSLRRLAVGHAQSTYSELAPPWGMSFPAASGNAGFHLMFAGRCWLKLLDGAGRWLEQGDVALLPHGAGHSVSDRPESPTPPYYEAKAAQPSGRPTQHVLLCGAYKFGGVGPDPVLALLPEIVHLPAKVVAESRAFAAVLTALREEARATPTGHSAAVSSLVDAVFVYLVRCWFTHEDPVDAQWFSALRDPGLSRSLARIHAAPADRWTVEKLAEIAGMSRAVFARRFTQQVGASPLAYVASRRLDQAARLLRESDRPLGEIASAVGYESEFALSRAFKRSRSLAPGRYRATHRAV